MDVDEVMYVAKELWHGRSAREPSAKDVGRGMWRSVNELMLVRYGAFIRDHFRACLYDMVIKYGRVVIGTCNISLLTNREWDLQMFVFAMQLFLFHEASFKAIIA